MGPTKIIKATKTLALIEEKLRADQGARYRELLRTTLPLIEDAYRGDEDEFRSHLGASILGRACAREVWYSWHWTTKKEFGGQMLRLFNRGHLEEGRFVALLLMIGCTVWQFDDKGNQFRISGHGGHYGGGMDGVVTGLPDLPGEPVLAEFKTHNDKSFSKLLGEGVRFAKPEHFVQMQQYMGGNNLKWAAYFATNKNDDHIHAELVAFDSENYARFSHRAEQLVGMGQPPARINDSASWYQCRFCDHGGVCHGQDLPAVNCRTCAHSRPGPEGSWLCTETRNTAAFGDLVTLSKADQLRGCENYEVNRAMKE